MRLALLPILLSIACGGHHPATENPTVSAPPAAPESTLNDEVVSPPFSAADLRDGFPPGTELRLRIETTGKPTVIQHWTFTAADAEGCTIHSRTLTEDGSLISEDESRSTWAELATHGQFPAARTTRTDASVDVIAGHFDTWLFVVEPEKPGAPTKRMHFARNFPGPPVLMEVIQNDTVILRMELVSRTTPPR